MTRDFPAGNYRFFRRCSSTRAVRRIQLRDRARALRPLAALAEGFALPPTYPVRRRPLTSFCACELRSPAAFTEDGFRVQRALRQALAEWGLFDGVTNPWRAATSAPRSIRRRSRHFMLSVYPGEPASRTTPTFVIAGGAEARGGSGSYPAHRALPRPHAGAQREGPFHRRRHGRASRRVRVRLKETTAVSLYRARLPSVAADELVRRAPGSA